ncbi:amidohydrolase [Litorisediminicola beolgyonensis]|uniref:Amidohydrolase n=1 Tax=Litorisediminicola beolgyonensis TaxID=1173614 RepID=A0ABW3ZIG4_9RHOB
MLSNSDLVELTAFRRLLHQWPETSGEETDTARRIADALVPLGPTQVLTGFGGTGVAAIFASDRPGPTVLFRAELDALPIPEEPGPDWRSQVPGKGHLCGHDGHMTILLALGRLLARRQVAQGRVVLMFQPAEEDGSGARAVVADPRYAEIAPDWVFALHNDPGRPLGEVGLCDGLVNCASRGLAVTLSGRTAHAATPETGISPAPALAELIPALTALAHGDERSDAFRMATITHARLGEPTFGIAPGEALLHVTLRTAQDDAMAALAAEADAIITDVAERHGLTVSMTVQDDFAASINAPEAVAMVRAALDALGVPVSGQGLPMRASEDFGVFGWQAGSAMFCLGSGETCPPLHDPRYDFPDDLIPIGAAIFERIARDLLGGVAQAARPAR